MIDKEGYIYRSGDSHIIGHLSDMPPDLAEHMEWLEKELDRMEKLADMWEYESRYLESDLNDYKDGLGP